MPQIEKQNLKRLLSIIPKNPFGLILALVFSALFIILNGATRQLIALGLPGSLSTIVSLLLIFLFFAVYVKLSESNTDKRHLPWYSIFATSLILCALAWSNCGTVWLWFSPINLINAIPQILGTSILAFFLYFLTACFICSLLFLLISGWLVKTPMIKTVVQNHISILFFQSIIIAVILVLLLVLISFINVIFAMNELMAIAFFFIFHISYVIVSTSPNFTVPPRITDDRHR